MWDMHGQILAAYTWKVSHAESWALTALGEEVRMALWTHVLHMSSNLGVVGSNAVSWEQTELITMISLIPQKHENPQSGQSNISPLPHPDTGQQQIHGQKHNLEARIKQDFLTGPQPCVGEDESNSEMIFSHLIISSRVFFQEYLITFGIPVRC